MPVQEFLFTVDPRTDKNLSSINEQLRSLTNREDPLTLDNFISFDVIGYSGLRSVVIRVTMEVNAFYARTTFPVNGAAFSQTAAPQAIKLIFNSKVDEGSITGTSIKYNGANVAADKISLESDGYTLSVDTSGLTYDAVQTHTVELISLRDRKGNGLSKQDVFSYVVGTSGSATSDRGNPEPYTYHDKVGDFKVTSFVIDRYAKIADKITEYLKTNNIDRDSVIAQDILNVNEHTLEVYILYFSDLFPSVIRTFPQEGALVSSDGVPTEAVITFSQPTHINITEANNITLDGVDLSASGTLSDDNRTLRVNVSGKVTDGSHFLKIQNLYNELGRVRPNPPISIGFTAADVADNGGTGGGGGGGVAGTGITGIAPDVGVQIDGINNPLITLGGDNTFITVSGVNDRNLSINFDESQITFPADHVSTSIFGSPGAVISDGVGGIAITGTLDGYVSDIAITGAQIPDITFPIGTIGAFEITGIAQNVVENLETDLAAKATGTNFDTLSGQFDTFTGGFDTPGIVISDGDGTVTVTGTANEYVSGVTLIGDNLVADVTILPGGTGNLQISHQNIPNATGVNNSGNTVVQDIEVDSFGHVIGSTSHTITPSQIGAVDTAVFGNPGVVISDGSGSITITDNTDTYVSNIAISGAQIQNTTFAIGATGTVTVTGIAQNVVIGLPGDLSAISSNISDNSSAIASNDIDIANIISSLNSGTGAGILYVASGDSVSKFNNDAGYLTEHPDVSAESDINNAGATFIQDLSFDSFGHVVTSVSTTVTPVVIGAEPTITAGTSTEYYRGDKTFATLNVAAVDGLETALNAKATGADVDQNTQDIATNSGDILDRATGTHFDALSGSFNAFTGGFSTSGITISDGDGTVTVTGTANNYVSGISITGSNISGVVSVLPGETGNLEITGFSAGITEETDPVFTTSDAAGITSVDISNWNSAYTHSTGINVNPHKVSIGNIVAGSFSGLNSAILDAELVKTGDNISLFNNDSGYINAHPNVPGSTTGLTASANSFIQAITSDSTGHLIGVVSAPITPPVIGALGTSSLSSGGFLRTDGTGAVDEIVDTSTYYSTGQVNAISGAINDEITGATGQLYTAIAGQNISVTYFNDTVAGDATFTIADGLKLTGLATGIEQGNLVAIESNGKISNDIVSGATITGTVLNADYVLSPASTHNIEIADQSIPTGKLSGIGTAITANFADLATANHTHNLSDLNNDSGFLSSGDFGSPGLLIAGGDGTFTVTSDVTSYIGDGTITNDQLAGDIVNNKLRNSTISVHYPAGSFVSGDGSVSLGDTLNISSEALDDYYTKSAVNSISSDISGQIDGSTSTLYTTITSIGYASGNDVDTISGLFTGHSGETGIHFTLQNSIDTANNVATTPNAVYTYVDSVSGDITGYINSVSGDLTGYINTVSGDLTGYINDVSGDITGYLQNDVTTTISYASGDTVTGSTSFNLGGTIYITGLATGTEPGEVVTVESTGKIATGLVPAATITGVVLSGDYELTPGSATNIELADGSIETSKIVGVGTAITANHADFLATSTFNSPSNDKIVKSDGAGSVTFITDSSDFWTEAYNWGNHANSGYATGNDVDNIIDSLQSGTGAGIKYLASGDSSSFYAFLQHDSLSGYVANEHIDWTAVSAGTIDATNLPNATTSATGIVRLSDSVSSGDTQKAATPNSVYNYVDSVSGILASSGGGSTTFTGLTDTPNDLSTGEIYYSNNGSSVAGLKIGSNGRFLKSNGSVPSWAGITFSDVDASSFSDGDILFVSGGSVVALASGSSNTAKFLGQNSEGYPAWEAVEGSSGSGATTFSDLDNVDSSVDQGTVTGGSLFYYNGTTWAALDPPNSVDHVLISTGAATNMPYWTGAVERLTGTWLNSSELSQIGDVSTTGKNHGDLLVYDTGLAAYTNSHYVNTSFQTPLKIHSFTYPGAGSTKAPGYIGVVSEDDSTTGSWWSSANTNSSEQSFYSDVYSPGFVSIVKSLDFYVLGAKDNSPSYAVHDFSGVFSVYPIEINGGTHTTGSVAAEFTSEIPLVNATNTFIEFDSPITGANLYFQFVLEKLFTTGNVSFWPGSPTYAAHRHLRNAQYVFNYELAGITAVPGGSTANFKYDTPGNKLINIQDIYFDKNTTGDQTISGNIVLAANKTLTLDYTAATGSAAINKTILVNHVDDEILTATSTLYTTTTSYINDVSGVLSAEIDSDIAALNLADLSDVTISSPADGEVLKYNGVRWYNGTDNSGSGGGGSTDLGPAEAFAWFVS